VLGDQRAVEPWRWDGQAVDSGSRPAWLFDAD
jgi:hypothetical protein